MSATGRGGNDGHAAGQTGDVHRRGAVRGRAVTQLAKPVHPPTLDICPAEELREGISHDGVIDVSDIAIVERCRGWEVGV